MAAVAAVAAVAAGEEVEEQARDFSISNFGREHDC